MTGSRSQTAPGQADTSQVVEETARLVVPFDDNLHLPHLLGEYDSHLSLLEDRLGIDVHAHGNVIVLKGSEASCKIARGILEELYERVTKGEIVGPGDFDGLLRHNDSDKKSGKSSSNQGEISTRRKIIKARTRQQTNYINALYKDDLVFGIGPAGTGKTYLAVTFAAHCLEKGLVDRIILSRPAVEAGERLGFLPGDMREKVDPYLRPLYDALYDVLPPEKVEKDLESGVIEIAPLAFMRGRTLSNAFVILDEAQNTTTMQMKMFLTRLGEGSKMAVTGDPSQVDLPSGMTSGLMQAVDLLENIRGIEAIRFSAADVVRRDLVARIVDAYDRSTS